MTHSNRFNNAISKLYKAFTSQQLEPECACKCAVGTLLDGKDQWKHLTKAHGSTELSYVGKVHERLGRKFAGYSPLELLQIEEVFLKGCGYKVPLDYQNKTKRKKLDASAQFDGLCAVIQLLCQLDQVKDVLYIQGLFRNSRVLTATA